MNKITVERACVGVMLAFAALHIVIWRNEAGKWQLYRGMFSSGVASPNSQPA